MECWIWNWRWNRYFWWGVKDLIQNAVHQLLAAIYYEAQRIPSMFVEFTFLVSQHEKDEIFASICSEYEVAEVDVGFGTKNIEVIKRWGTGSDTYGID